MKNYFGFIDETGVLSHDPDQRFFALGLLKCEDTSALYQELQIFKNRIEALHNERRLAANLGPRKNGIEFKFHDIIDTNKDQYCDLLNLYFRFSALQFSCLILDKDNPDFKANEIFPNAWEAYIGYSNFLAKKSIQSNDQLCIIADFLGKPKSSSKFYEIELRKLPNIYNVTFLESHASLFIQIVDVLVGSVVFDFRRNRQPHLKHNQAKGKVADFLKQKLGLTSMAIDVTLSDPSFSIWEFKPKEGILGDK